MTLELEQIQKAITTGKVAGSWLITGGNEYEKKSFITECCSLLLNQKFNDFNVFHPDIKWLECGLTEESKKEIQKNILAGKTVDDSIEISRKREITVEDVRQGIQFLSLKSAPDHWRILIINPADKMNENAANALLKELEEPGERSIIFLLCQNIGQLLPTIKSRCRKITIRPLSKEVLATRIQSLYPAIEDIDTVVRLSEGSLGLAKDICDHDGVALYQTMTSLFSPTTTLSVEAVKSFSDDVSQNQSAFDLVHRFMLNWIADQAKANALTNPFIAEDFLDLYNEINMLFIDIDRIYLDKKQVLQTSIFKIAEVLS